MDTPLSSASVRPGRYPTGVHVYGDQVAVAVLCAIARQGYTYRGARMLVAVLCAIAKGYRKP